MDKNNIIKVQESMCEKSENLVRDFVFDLNTLGSYKPSGKKKKIMISIHIIVLVYSHPNIP